MAAEEADLAGLDAADSSAGAGEFVAHVEVPDQDTIKQAILARRKQDLLARLATEEGVAAMAEPQGPTVQKLDKLKRLPANW